MRVTIREVAREAGVSVATVSRVLNGSGPASAETVRRIREVAARLRYTPNEAARSLIRSRTQTIGVLLPDLHGAFFSEVIRGVDQRARQAGFHLLVSSFHDDPREMEAALQAMRGRVDGLVVMAPDVATRALLDELSGDLIAVLLNPPTTDGTCSAVRVDNVGGARTMVRHLVGLGRQRIAMITGDERNHDAHERRRGYRAALRAAGLPVSAELEARGDFTEPSGYAAAQVLLRLSRRPDAIFAANDAMAVGALSALRDAGVRVPEDVALVGFDDIPIAQYLTPPLTSVHVDMDALGRRATELVLAAIGAQSDKSRRVRPRDEMLPTTLVVRSSCGAGEGRRARGAPTRGGARRGSGAGGAPRRRPSGTNGRPPEPA